MFNHVMRSKIEARISVFYTRHTIEVLVSQLVLNLETTSMKIVEDGDKLLLRTF